MLSKQCLQDFFVRMESLANDVEQLRRDTESLTRLSNEETCDKVRLEIAQLETRWQTMQSRQKELKEQAIGATKQNYHVKLVAVHSQLSKARELLSKDIECSLDAVHKHKEQLEVINIICYY